jgi:pimeloyl-ACP methyl ester carboxylesterase
MTRTPVQSQVMVRGLEIALWEWPGEEPAVFFCHATSFHARIWDQVIAALPGRRCVAFDARGHGRSSKPALDANQPYAWRNFGADVAALAKVLGLRGAVGVGHSLGAHSIALGAALEPQAFSALVLFDPVIRAHSEYRGPWGKSAFVTKRRNQWASAQEMFDRFADRPPFDSWDRRVLRDYCDYALEPSGGGYILACPPAVEASIYDDSTAVESNIYPEIATVHIPVHVIRAGSAHDPANVMGASVALPTLASHFAHGRDACLAEHSHFIPMESPTRAAKLVANAL